MKSGDHGGAGGPLVGFIVLALALVFLLLA
jgi:hypothetical protein